MCGRFTLADIGQVSLRFGLDDVSEAAGVDGAPRYNIAPSQQILTVREQAGRRTVSAMRWGFSPAWLKSSKAPAPFNARSETLLELPMFRGAVKSHRCLIPADGFYEWQVRLGTKTKQPMYIHLRDGSVFAFAGIFTRAADGQETCAIITTIPNDLMAPIHNRMPAILNPRDESAWLDPELTESPAIVSMLQPYPPELMEAYPVAALVGAVRNEGLELIARQA